MMVTKLKSFKRIGSIKFMRGATVALDVRMLNEIGARCTNLRLLNIAACALQSTVVEQWLSNSRNVPQCLHGINISCNVGLRIETYM